MIKVFAALVALAMLIVGAPLKPRPARVWRIMPFGDSITVGQTWPKVDFASGWRPLLAPMIKDAFVYVGTQLDAAGAHEGHGGNTLAQLNVIAAAGAVTASAPDYVLFMAGTNDIAQHRTAEQAIADLTTLLATIRAAAPSATIVLGQIPYVATWDMLQLHDADLFNAHIATIAGPWVPRSKRVDMRGVHLSADNVHPDAQGYQDMASRWLPFLPIHGLRPA